jgi:PBP1b-binding outer membrane lipoprotein LpoB
MGAKMKHVLTIGLLAMTLAGCQAHRPTVQVVSSSEAIITRSVTIASGSSILLDFDVAQNPDQRPRDDQGFRGIPALQQE